MLPQFKNYAAFSHALEQSEIAYWRKYYTPCSGLSPRMLEILGGTACALPEIDILAFNRVIGLGWTSEGLNHTLDALISFYGSCSCRRFFVQLSPAAPAQQQVVEALSEKGFRYYNSWSKLWCRIPNSPPVNSFLDIQLIRADQSLEYSQILLSSFSWQDERLGPFLAATIGTSGYRHYLVQYEGEAVAAGALHLSGKYASMAFGATLPAFRSMGAQSLLIQRRIQDAALTNAQFLVAETAVGRPEAPVQSSRNLQRFGFQLAYNRANWIFEF